MEGSLAERRIDYVVEPLRFDVKSCAETVGVLGLGYVGLPVALALAEKYETVHGFDVNSRRIAALRAAHDWTDEVPDHTLLDSSLNLTCMIEDLVDCSMYVVAVPTPINAENQPDFEPLISACKVIGPLLRKGTIVVFESTVHPGATEEICGPELEARSGLTAGTDFHLAYSPERISPGDHQHGLKSVTKIISAQSPAAMERVAEVYEAIVPAGVHRAPSIKVAEAAKVFENTQRDVNIALMNELSQICEKLGIRTTDVVNATATKWNALPFTPGLVGGHCIGVDPHYLVTCAEKLGVRPEIMRAARHRNETLPQRIVSRAVRFLSNADLRLRGARVGVLGVTFKENVPDIRNSKVFDVISGLRELGINPLVADSVATPQGCLHEGVQLSNIEALGDLDLLILAVPHKPYLAGRGRYLQSLLRPGGTIMDIRAALDPGEVRDDLHYWSL